MKQGIHPENYRPVVFKDMSNGDMFPFYTGKSKLVDTAGRVDRFMNRVSKLKISYIFRIYSFHAKVRSNVVAYALDRTFFHAISIY